MENKDKWAKLLQFVSLESGNMTTEETSRLMDIVTKTGGIEKYAEAVEKRGFFLSFLLFYFARKEEEKVCTTIGHF